MVKPSNVLFVSHEASATGAVHSLLGLIGWLSVESSLSIRTLCLSGGPKVESFGEFGAVEIAKSASESQLKPLLSDLDLIVLNSVVSASALPALASLGCPIVAWIHELEYEISLLERESREALASIPSHYIACSEAVANNLQSQLGIPTDAITTIGEIVSIENILERSNEEDAAPLRAQLGLGAAVKLVGAMGTPSWRKGVDLFLASAAAYLKNENFPAAHFIWIGGNEQIDEKKRIVFEVGRLGLKDYVTFTGALKNPFPCLKALDIFCLTSREDPYPLVMIEAKILKLPIIGFAGSGGFDEFARDFGARLVPPETAGGMADSIAAEISSREPLSADQDLSALDVSTMGPRFLTLINELKISVKSSVGDVQNAVNQLVQQHYLIGVRLVSNGSRLQEYSLPCPLNKPWSLRCELPSDVQGNRLRLAFSSGPAIIEISSVKLLSPGKEICHIDFHRVCKTSRSVTICESQFYVTGHDSHLHIPLPSNASGLLEIDLRILRIDSEMLAVAAKLDSSTISH